MNRKDFISLLANPELKNPEHTALLGEIVARFPYFQSAQLLLAKSLYEQNSIDYNSQLKLAAAYSGDRRVLYSLITPVSSLQKESTRLNAEQEFKTETKKITSLQQQPVVSDQSLKKSFRSGWVETTTDEVNISETTLSSKQIPFEPVPSDKIQEEHKTETTSSKDSPRDILEKRLQELKQELEILKNTVRQDYIPASFPLQSTPSPIPREKQKVPTPVEEVKTAVNLSFPSVEHTLVPPTGNTGTRSFTEWLTVLRKQPGDQLLQHPTTEKQITSGQEVSQKELIEKFISEEPRIVPKVEFFSPINIARQSVTDQGGIVSETLAQIYLKQGNIAKALSTYERLCLLYPEKSDYFAAQIKFIKSLPDLNK